MCSSHLSSYFCFVSCSCSVISPAGNLHKEPKSAKTTTSGCGGGKASGKTTSTNEPPMVVDNSWSNMPSWWESSTVPIALKSSKAGSAVVKSEKAKKSSPTPPRELCSCSGCECCLLSCHASSSIVSCLAHVVVVVVVVVFHHQAISMKRKGRRVESRPPPLPATARLARHQRRSWTLSRLPRRPIGRLLGNPSPRRPTAVNPPWSSRPRRTPRPAARRLLLRCCRQLSVSINELTCFRSSASSVFSRLLSSPSTRSRRIRGRMDGR